MDLSLTKDLKQQFRVNKPSKKFNLDRMAFIKLNKKYQRNKEKKIKEIINMMMKISLRKIQTVI